MYPMKGLIIALIAAQKWNFNKLIRAAKKCKTNYKNKKEDSFQLYGRPLLYKKGVFMDSRDIIDLLEGDSCIGCTYMSETPIKCKCIDCEYKTAIKAAIKTVKAKEKTKEKLKAIEQNRNYRKHDSNFWEGFYMAEEVFYECFNEGKFEAAGAESARGDLIKSMAAYIQQHNIKALMELVMDAINTVQEGK